MKKLILTAMCALSIGCAGLTDAQRQSIASAAHLAVFDIAQYLSTGKLDIRGAISQVYSLMSNGQGSVTFESVNRVVGYVIKDQAERDAITQSVMDTVSKGLQSGLKKDDAIKLGIQALDAAIADWASRPVK